MDPIIDTSRMGYVYRTTNVINGKSYIGQHRIRDGEEWLSYLGSGTAIARAIRKHGRASFSKELLAYANDQDELNSLENHFINRELEVRGDQIYNILSAPSETLNRRTIESMSDFDVLEMYFEDKLSTADIADILGVSQPAIHAYLKRFKDSDPRFKEVKQGRSLGPSKRIGQTASQEASLKLSQRMLSLSKTTCAKCGDVFTEQGAFATHLKSCDGIPWPHCGFCEKRLSKRGAKYCGDHKYKSQRL